MICRRQVKHLVVEKNFWDVVASFHIRLTDTPAKGDEGRLCCNYGRIDMEYLKTDMEYGKVDLNYGMADIDYDLADKEYWVTD